MSRFATMPQLMAAAKCSRLTILNWQKRGLLPRPTIGLSKNGRGRCGYWPASCVYRVKRIRHLQTDWHVSLADIATHLGPVTQ